MLIIVPDHALMFVSWEIRFYVICEHISDEKSKRNQRSEKKVFWKCFIFRISMLSDKTRHTGGDTLQRFSVNQRFGRDPDINTQNLCKPEILG